MKTIIAPTDFSSTSYNACLYAAKMAEDIQAELVLLHVMELPVAAAEFPVTEDAFDEAGTEAALDGLRKKLLSETNNKVKIISRNIPGSVEYELKELCDEKKPFVVVMATHAGSLADRLLLGSTTIYSARHLHYPVWVIPPNTVYKPLEKIALASDLKDIYAMPAHEIETIVKTFEARLEVLYVGKNEKNINRNTIGSLLLGHRLLNLEPEFHFIENEDIMKGVTSFAKDHKVDAVLLVSKKHGPFHKSQSKDFILYSPVPVIIIHEKDAAEHA